VLSQENAQGGDGVKGRIWVGEKRFFGEKVGLGKRHSLGSRCVLGEMGLRRKCSSGRRWAWGGDESSRMDSGQGGSGWGDVPWKIHNTLWVF
jgi:hypothetical protein